MNIKKNKQFYNKFIIAALVFILTGTPWAKGMYPTIATASLLATGCSIGFALYKTHMQRPQLHALLRDTVKTGDLEKIISLLKQYDYTLNSYPDGHTILDIALFSNNFTLANALIKAGLRVDQSYYTTLCFYPLNKKLLNYALKKGASINGNNDDTISPLHCALRQHFHTWEKEHLDWIKTLVQFGADVTKKDIHYKTAYDYALEQNNIKIKEYIRLAYYYKIERMQNTIPEFLKELNFEQRQDILDIALAQCHSSTLEEFYKLDRKIYSWLYLLALAEQQNLSAPVPFLLTKMMTYPTKETTKEIKIIYEDAKANDKTDFGQAMFDFYKTARTISGTFKSGQKLPKETTALIMQFRKQNK
jgi:ankyrin repeat protein